MNGLYVLHCSGPNFLIYKSILYSFLKGGTGVSGARGDQVGRRVILLPYIILDQSISSKLISLKVQKYPSLIALQKET